MTWNRTLCDGLQPPESAGDLTVRLSCPCQRFDDGALPEPGERPVFGVHRLASADAAWATESDSVRERKFREWVKGAPGDIA
jgi:hypothetical protein